MRENFTPEQTRHWTDTDPAALVGKYVTVDVPASPEYIADGGKGDYEGGSGVCVAADMLPDGQTIYAQVLWDYGMTWWWVRDQGAWVGVCDEHGDHELTRGGVQDPAVLACLETLGAPAVAGVTD